MSLAEMIRRVAGGHKARMSDDEKPDMEDDEKDPAAEGDDPPKDDGSADEETDPDAEGDDPPKDDEASAEDEESDKDMSSAEKKAFAKGRLAERSRIGAILGSKHAESNPALAAHLAFKTGDSSKKALGVLQHGGGKSAGGSGLSDRMNARGLSRTGRGGETDVRSKNADASSWENALARSGKLKDK